MSERKRDLNKTLRRRYFVDDAANVLFWLFGALFLLDVLLLGSIFIRSYFGWGSCATWSMKPLFIIGAGLVLCMMAALEAPSVYRDISKRFDQRAVNKGRFIPLGMQRE